MGGGGEESGRSCDVGILVFRAASLLCSVTGSVLYVVGFGLKGPSGDGPWQMSGQNGKIWGFDRNFARLCLDDGGEISLCDTGEDGLAKSKEGRRDLAALKMACWAGSECLLGSRAGLAAAFAAVLCTILSFIRELDERGLRSWQNRAAMAVQAGLAWASSLAAGVLWLLWGLGKAWHSHSHRQFLSQGWMAAGVLLLVASIASLVELCLLLHKLCQGSEVVPSSHFPDPNLSENSTADSFPAVIDPHSGLRMKASSSRTRLALPELRLDDPATLASDTSTTPSSTRDEVALHKQFPKPPPPPSSSPIPHRPK